MNKEGKEALIFDIQKFSVHDGPGIRTIIFFKGCPLHCPWCSNPESQQAVPQLVWHADKCIECGNCVLNCGGGALSLVNGQPVRKEAWCVSCGNCTEFCYAGAWKLYGRVMGVDAVMEEIEKDLVFFRNSGGGVTFGGGEPMLHPEFIGKVAARCKENNISTAIETCGSVEWKNFEMVVEWIDLVLFDLKHMDPEAHRKLTGRSNRLILENLEKLSCMSDLEVIVRVPVIPGCNDSKRNIKETAVFISSLKGSVSKVHLLPYHRFGEKKYEILNRNYELRELTPPDDVFMQRMKTIFEEQGLETTIGG